MCSEIDIDVDIDVQAHTYVSTYFFLWQANTILIFVFHICVSACFINEIYNQSTVNLPEENMPYFPLP